MLILSAVAPRPLHGYGLIQAVEELSGGELRLRPGTLYAALDRMVGDGWVAAAGEEVVDGRTRRYYQITDAGLDVLDAEASRLERHAANARRLMALRVSPT